MNSLIIKLNFVQINCLLQHSTKASYATRVKNILRNRYPHRARDGSFLEYNESITILPKEFQHQDEFKSEKKLSEMHKKRYLSHQTLKQSLYGVKLPERKKPKEEDSLLEDIDEIVKCDHANTDKPVQLTKDPFARKMDQCIFCTHNIPLDYKNVELLSQFVSPSTGILYSQQITGLCIHKYNELEKTVTKAKRLGLMPYFYKETIFVDQHKLFNQFQNNLRKIPDNYSTRKLNAEDLKAKSDD